MPKPLFQSEAKYEAIDMNMNYYPPANDTHFHKKGFESGSLWNSEMAYSRENKNSPTCNLDFNVRRARAVVASLALQVISLAFLFIFTLSPDLLS